MTDKGKEGSFKPIVIVMIVSLAIAFFWDHFNFISSNAHAILDPVIGNLLDWNLIFGMLIVIFIVALFITILQKYTTDQEELKKLKDEQKEVQKQMKELKEHPEKMMHLQKKQFETMPKMMKLSMRSIVWTSVPLILLIRWFYDYFEVLETTKVLGVHWIIFYIVGTMIFSMIFRKIFNVV